MDETAAMRATELGEAEFVFRRLSDATDESKKRLGISTARIGGGVVTVMANDPTGGFFNVCVGLGQTEPLTEAILDEVIEFARGAGAPLVCFQVAPGADPARWPALFADARAGRERLVGEVRHRRPDCAGVRHRSPDRHDRGRVGRGVRPGPDRRLRDAHGCGPGGVGCRVPHLPECGLEGLRRLGRRRAWSLRPPCSFTIEPVCSRVPRHFRMPEGEVRSRR